MTKEEKELLVKDLSARLPYGVKLDVEWIAPMSGSPEHSIRELSTFEIEVIKTSIELGEEGDRKDGKMRGLVICDDGKDHFVDGFMCKPFLRPMSSMTKEEEKEYFGFYFYEKNVFANTLGAFKLVDWLNEHYFDYRGLVEKGLAIKATEGMYNTETNKETTEL